MLELRLKDGSIKALGYSWLERAEFDPSDGLSLYFGAHLVRIVGRNLNSEARPNVRLLDGKRSTIHTVSTLAASSQF